MNSTTQAIRKRILLMALVPGLLISLIMSSLFLWSRFSELEHQLIEKAQTSTARLATFIDFAYTQDDLEHIRELINLALEDKEVRSINLLDEYGREVFHAGPKVERSPGFSGFSYGTNAFHRG